MLSDAGVRGSKRKASGLNADSKRRAGAHLAKKPAHEAVWPTSGLSCASRSAHSTCKRKTRNLQKYAATA